MLSVPELCVLETVDKATYDQSADDVDELLTGGHGLHTADSTAYWSHFGYVVTSNKLLSAGSKPENS